MWRLSGGLLLQQDSPCILEGVDAELPTTEAARRRGRCLSSRYFRSSQEARVQHDAHQATQHSDWVGLRMRAIDNFVAVPQLPTTSSAFDPRKNYIRQYTITPHNNAVVVYTNPILI
eukprot:6475017-Amphidinium_carterae.1